MDIFRFCEATRGGAVRFSEEKSPAAPVSWLAPGA
jgi:hypothetical protein